MPAETRISEQVIVQRDDDLSDCARDDDIGTSDRRMQLSVIAIRAAVTRRRDDVNGTSDRKGHKSESECKRRCDEQEREILGCDSASAPTQWS